MSSLKFVLADLVRRGGQRLVALGRRNGFEDEEKTKLVLNEFGLHLTLEKHSFFTRKLWLPRSLKEESGVVFSLVNGEELLIETKNFKAIVQSEEDLFILNEILVAGTYNFDHHRPVVVLDVGMNAGIAALSFAAMENVLAVIGYEPFSRTYQQAQRNFGLNPELASKIITHNTGLGAYERNLTVEYCYEWKGSVSILGFPDHKRPGQTISAEDIVLEDVCKVLDSIVARYPGIDIVAKIDCEGAEYELIEALCSANKISAVKIIMMEWHNNGPETLMNRLRASGFSAFSLMPNGKVGMIYSVNSDSGFTATQVGS